MCSFFTLPQLLSILRLAQDLKDGTASVDAFIDIKEHVLVEVFGNEEVQSAVGKCFMRGGLRGSGRRRSSLGSNSSSQRRSSQRRNSTESCGSANNLDEEDVSHGAERLMSILQSGGGGNVGLARPNNHSCLNSVILAREDVIGNDENDDGVSRKTSLIKIDLSSCGSPPYEPGDHVRVFPNNSITETELGRFIGNLSDDIDLKDYVFIGYTGEAAKQEIAVTYPLLHSSLDGLTSVNELFGRLVALDSSLTMQACEDLALQASSVKDRTLLLGISQDEQEYESMISLCGLKWKDVFSIFPSLCGRVPLALMLLHMKVNHPRSYSIASCKEQVGSELHLVVGR